ncbi:MAG: decaprenyl-phosphate phosphoribosyltransferase [Kofleriaceae bacterium]|nr:decaprenyl-phosphate phosphoribosyltransferase [Kofleriaceae bacterium]
MKTLRPHQWVKNLFVAAPLVFSKHLLDSAYVLRTAIAVAAFCALSGAVYAFNDLRDVEADRAHPTKRHRPIASGRLPERFALVLAIGLAVAALAAAAALHWKVAAIGAAYLTVNLAYSLGLKQLAFVDVGLIAAGFLLRVLAGAHAIAVPASRWLLVCTGLLSAFLGLGKRAHELAAASRAGRDAAATRAALAGYRAPAVRATMAVLAIATTAAYVLYTLDDHTVRSFGTRDLMWTAPFCAAGVGRFAWLALASRDDDSPTELMLRDWPFLANLVAWAATVLVIIYGAR